MCCFSAPVKHVSDTSIFVRNAGGARQFLVYGMSFVASEDLAMVLPLPVPPRTPEDGVRFISLEKCSEFFKVMASGFPPRPAPRAPAGFSLGGGSLAVTLKVHAVGGFEASFVPTLGDFGRLDPRFRLPGEVWDQLPQYGDYGFAVFKLRAKGRPVDVHPMAFEFPRRDPDAFFVPTVHIHDGRYRPLARFDHDIYCQTGNGSSTDAGLEPSSGPARTFMNHKCMDDLVDGEAAVFRQTLRGSYRNADVNIRRGADGRFGLRLEGSAEQAAWSGGADELAGALVAEIVLEHPDAVGECRRRYPDLHRWGNSMADAAAQSRRVEEAVSDLIGRLGPEIARARQRFIERAPRGLRNAADHFGSGLDRLQAALKVEE